MGFSVVTGAFGNTGRFITRKLLAGGEQVKTLTDHPVTPDPFGGRVTVAPFNFGDPSALVESLRGTTTLYNTYWARFSYGGMTYDKAVSNSRALIDAAKAAGVGRIVQITVTKASEDSPLAYFRGKGQVERAVIESGLSYAVLRPSLIFGPGCILINDIAWLLRRFPVFAIPGRGDYRLGAIHVEDVAELAVKAGKGVTNEIIDAVGPDTFTFDELVGLIASAIHSRAKRIHVNPRVALLLASATGKLVHDIILEQWEIDALMAGMMCSDGPATGEIRLANWLTENAASLGVKYHSELARHYQPS